MDSSSLSIELKYFESIKEELLKHHKGKYALVIGEELIGTFDHPEEAYRIGLEKRGNAPMLIKLVTKEETPETMPTMSLGLFNAHL